MNTVDEDEETRAELINTSSSSERTPAQADPGLLPASFSSCKKKKISHASPLATSEEQLDCFYALHIIGYLVGSQQVDFIFLLYPEGY